ncbi:MAG: 50S ribosomal protein L29 [Candidatus Micrarchaeia archaeon]
MKVKDIKNMSTDEMKAKIADLEKELSIEYGTRSSAAGKSRNYGKIRTIKKTIARMKTFIRARELGILGNETNKEKIQNKK